MFSSIQFSMIPHRSSLNEVLNVGGGLIAKWNGKQCHCLLCKAIFFFHLYYIV